MAGRRDRQGKGGAQSPPEPAPSIGDSYMAPESVAKRYRATRNICVIANGQLASVAKGEAIDGVSASDLDGLVADGFAEPIE